MVDGDSTWHSADSGAHNDDKIIANGADASMKVDDQCNPQGRELSIESRHDGEISSAEHVIEHINGNGALHLDIDLIRDEKESIESPLPIRINTDCSNGTLVALRNGVAGNGHDAISTAYAISGGDNLLSINGDQSRLTGSLAGSSAEGSKQILSSPSSASIQTKRSSPRGSERAQPTPTLDKVSLLSRGISLFAKSPARQDIAYSERNDNDAISVVSELTHDVKSECKAHKPIAEEGDDDDALKLHLEESGLVLIKRLIEFLSECPPMIDDGSVHSALSDRRDESSQYHAHNKKRHRGLTLPASAIGWLSTQILHGSGTNAAAASGANDRCTTVPRQQIECLQSLLKRVTNIRVSGVAWPPPHASVPGKAAEDIARSAKKTIAANVMSRFARSDASTTGEENIVDGGSCGATPSRCDVENPVTEFQQFYHEILHKPDVNMAFFPNATKVVIDGIPPNWVTNLESLHKLDMFQMEKGCILDINQLFFSSDATDESSVAEGNQIDIPGSTAEQYEVSNRQKSSPFMHSSLSKLRLSNCAMGEAAGLRRRRTSSGMSLPPPLARFPNLVSLDLSRNELFRTKTAFAGLTDLPLLSSINLSYNRLSSMDDIFMHIGNVTELILTGNDITTTRGLDRIFSLERLSLDENKIQHLTNISGIAKMPFLMNFDLKGNPFEVDDPASCRVQVFNLFREVRCNKLPKDATFRDMQRLLPILDNEIATKDELVALKSLTYRHAVMSMDSIPSTKYEEGIANVESIDDRSEIYVNMPHSIGNNIRRIVKGSPVHLVHLRMPVPMTSSVKEAGQWSQIDSHIFSDGQRPVSVLFSMDELLASVRQIVVRDSFIDQNHIIRRETLQSFSSVHSECNDATARDESRDNPVSSSCFPFDLPPSLLAEADDDVWKPNELVIPSEDIVWDLDAENGDNTSSTNPHDAMHIPSHTSMLPIGDQSVNEEYTISTEYTPSNEEIADQSSTSESGFNGIWEKSYRDNVLTRQFADSVPIDLPERNADLLDLNAAEERSTYDGPPDYGPLLVISDIDLYFDTFVFPRDSPEDGEKDLDGRGERIAPRIQLFKFDRDLLINRYRQHQGAVLPLNKSYFRERFIGTWKVDVLACGSFARSRLPPVTLPRLGFHGDTIITRAGKEEMANESRKFILCLSESAIYFIIDDDISPPKHSRTKRRSFPSRISPTSTFSDACWPHAVVRHPLDCLLGITIGFQFQRLILRFSISNATTSSSLEFTYVIVTSNKLQTISLLQKIPVPVVDDSYQLQLPPPRMGSFIDNDDKTFLDSLGSPKSNEVVIHYQILLQYWKRNERRPTRRSFVLTDTRVCLLDETYVGDGTHPELDKDTKRKLGDVSLAIIDSAAISQVTEVRAANEDPRKITLVILPQNKLKRAHRWRLICNDGEGAERLVEDVRKTMGARA